MVSCSFQLVDLLEGQTPVDGRFGMFQPTWFSSRVEVLTRSAGVDLRARAGERAESHLDNTPHPMALMAFFARRGLGTWAAVLAQWLYLCLLVASLYLIGGGRRDHSVASSLH